VYYWRFLRFFATLLEISSQRRKNDMIDFHLMKIASLLPSATEIVCSLGLQENLVGVTHECDFPIGIDTKPHLTASRISHETMTSSEIDHAVRSQLDGHGSIYDLDTGLLEQLQPDLLITQELCDVCSVSYEIVSKAAKVYTADATVVSLEPTTIEEIFANIITISELVNAREKANDVIAGLRKRLDAVREKTHALTSRPRAFMLEWLEPVFAPGHWVPEQVEIAGGECLLGKPGEPSVTTTYDAIFESKPDIMVLIPCGYYTHDILRQLQFTRFPANWREMPAIENGEVWALDATSYFSRPGPRVVDGAEILAKIFHPDLFGQPNEAEAVRIGRDLLQFEQ
jgi:iron complex transport system substrate-binding protein